MEDGMPSRSLALSALLASLVVAACSSKPPAPPPPPAVSVAPVLQRDIAESDEFSGRLEAVDRTRAQLEQAHTAADLAQKDVVRAEKLVNVQAISREEFDSRTSAQANGVAAVRAAEAAVETARLNLEWTKVRSPIAGRVSRA